LSKYVQYYSSSRLALRNFAVSLGWSWTFSWRGFVDGFLDGRIAVDLPEGPSVVVSRDVLITMKRQAGRTQDLADLERLEESGGE
jgi:hypothetical protein